MSAEEIEGARRTYSAPLSVEVEHGRDRVGDRSAETPAANRRAAETPAANRRAAETPAANRRAAETPAANRRAAETPAANRPASGAPRRAHLALEGKAMLDV
jgi:hypothetical protein